MSLPRHRGPAAVALLALAAVALAADPAAPVPPIRALLVCGGCCHDYQMQKQIITEGTAARARIEWTVAYDPDKGTKHLNPVYEKADWAQGFDVVVHDECTADVKDLPVIDRILEPHRRGLPAVVLHCGMHCYRSEGFPKVTTPWFELTGLASTGHGAQLPITLSTVDADSLITKGQGDWTTINEELYNNFTGKLLDTAHALTRGKQVAKGRDGKEATSESVVTWTNAYRGKARVFATTLGHNNATVADPRYLDLITRGLLWSCDKLNDRYLKPFDPAATKFSWEKALNKPQSKEPPKVPPACESAAPEPENLAKGKPAKASSSQEGHPAEHGNDGDAGTRWCADDGATGHTWQVDLGQPADLTGCKVVWEFDEKNYRYKVEGSADVQTWKSLVDETQGNLTTQTQLHAFKAPGIRHVRITVTGLPDGVWASFNEFEVLGTK